VGELGLYQKELEPEGRGAEVAVGQL
jgi:hypothetical protein